MATYNFRSEENYVPLDASNVGNDSTVPGNSVADALDNLAGGVLNRPVPITLPLNAATVGGTSFPNAIGNVNVATPATPYTATAGGVTFLPSVFIAALPVGVTVVARVRPLLTGGGTATLAAPPTIGPTAGDYESVVLDFAGVSAAMADTSEIYGVDLGLDAGAGIIEETVAFAGYFGVYTEPP